MYFRTNENVHELYALSCGLNIWISSHGGCMYSGIQFNNSKDRYDYCTTQTQNSGVCVFGGHDHEGSIFMGF